MHVEILTEDNSGRRLLEHLVPKLIGALGEPHTWRLHSYRGVGRIPPRLSGSSDPSKRILLDQLPRLLRGYVKTAGVDAVVVVVDVDDRDCIVFLSELKSVAASCGALDLTMFRLAIEETEAWYLGDRAALQKAYPKARLRALDGYMQDSVCGTWELAAETIHPGGLAAVRKPGGSRPGDLKHEWANRIGPLMDPDTNRSPSFCKLRDGLRRLIATSTDNPPPAILPGQTPAG